MEAGSGESLRAAKIEARIGAHRLKWLALPCSTSLGRSKVASVLQLSTSVFYADDKAKMSKVLSPMHFFWCFDKSLFKRACYESDNAVASILDHPILDDTHTRHMYRHRDTCAELAPALVHFRGGSRRPFSPHYIPYSEAHDIWVDNQRHANARCPLSNATPTHWAQLMVVLLWRWSEMSRESSLMVRETS